MRGWIIAGLSLLGLIGCTLIPKPLQVENEQGLLPFPSAIQDLQLNQGKPVRWGGVIASVENRKSDTVIELVEYPLTNQAKPRVKDGGSRGRFRVHVAGFVEPQDYQQGRKLTVVGQLNEPEQGQIGEFEYLFPSVSSDHIYLWKQEQETEQTIIYYQRPLIYDYWYRPRWVKVQHRP